MEGSILQIDGPALLAMALLTGLQCFFFYVVFTTTYSHTEGFVSAAQVAQNAVPAKTNISLLSPSSSAYASTGGHKGIWEGSFKGFDLVPPGPCMPGCLRLPELMCDADPDAGEEDALKCRSFDDQARQSGLFASSPTSETLQMAQQSTWFCATPDPLDKYGLSKTRCTTGLDCAGCALHDKGNVIPVVTGSLLSST